MLPFLKINNNSKICLANVLLDNCSLKKKEDICKFYEKKLIFKVSGIL